MRSLAVPIFYLAYYVTSAVALGSQCSSPIGNGNAAAGDPYWLQSMPHVGRAAFNPSPSTYTVYRNVNDYGAVGDGIADDTNASFSSDVWSVSHLPSTGNQRCYFRCAHLHHAGIETQYSVDQNRCGLGCRSSTTTPALIYFPLGSYLVSSPIIRAYLNDFRYCLDACFFQFSTTRL
jgi:glucan 1,3-beta-glucosidase